MGRGGPGWSHEGGVERLGWDGVMRAERSDEGRVGW